MRRQAASVVAALFCLALPLGLAAQDPAVFYEDNCASCHTIGGGILGGPDLKGVTARRDREWLIQFMLAPEKFATDPAVKKMIAESDGMEMGATDGLTRELADALLTLIDQRSGTPAPPVLERPVTDAEIALGRALFTGQATLSASRTPCIACHAAGETRGHDAGRLGPDLTNARERLGGVAGAGKWLASPPGRMMKALYRPAPLTADESHALAAYLTAPVMATRLSRRTPSFLLPAVAATIVALALIGVVWRGRFRAVRGPLVERARRIREGGLQ